MEDKSEDGSAADLRLVLIGMTGSGKSSSGNTILGQKKFQAGFSATSVTRCCQLESADLMLEKGSIQVKHRVSVVDGPGFGGTDLSAEDIQMEISKCVSLSAPGPHAFLLVVPVGRYTEHQNQAVITMAKIFGEEAIRHHTVVLFTRGDDLEDTTIESYLRQAPDSLKDLVNRCGWRFHVFNNKDTSSSEQVRELLEKVDIMVGQRGFYTSAMYQVAEAIIREEEERLMRFRVEEEQREAGTRARKRAASMRQRSTGVSQESQELLDLVRGEASHQDHSQIRTEAKHSPIVLNKIKIIVSAVFAGLVLGAVVGAAVGLTLGTAGVLLGAVGGGLVGGLVGYIEGDEADTPREAVIEAVKQVAAIAAAAIGGH